MFGYHKALFGQMLALAALLGQALSGFLPVTIAAPIATVFAILLTRVNDHVSDHIRTEADRILEPNDETKMLLGMLLLIGLAFASAFAPSIGAAAAAVMGILVLFALMSKLIG